MAWRAASSDPLQPRHLLRSLRPRARRRSRASNTGEGEHAGVLGALTARHGLARRLLRSTSTPTSPAKSSSSSQTAEQGKQHRRRRARWCPRSTNRATWPGAPPPQIHFNPDISCEVFVLEPDGGAGQATPAKESTLVS